MSKKVQIKVVNGGYVVSYTDKDNKKQEVLKENVVQARKYAEKILKQ